jgi:hypothetical protein
MRRCLRVLLPTERPASADRCRHYSQRCAGVSRPPAMTRPTGTCASRSLEAYVTRITGRTRGTRWACGVFSACETNGARRSYFIDSHMAEIAMMTEPTRKTVHTIITHRGGEAPSDFPISQSLNSRIAATTTRTAQGGARKRNTARRQSSPFHDGFRSQATTLIAAATTANSSIKRMVNMWHRHGDCRAGWLSV